LTGTASTASMVEQVWCTLSIDMSSPTNPTTSSAPATTATTTSPTNQATILLGCIYRPEDIKDDEKNTSNGLNDKKQKDTFKATPEKERDGKINEIIKNLGTLIKEPIREFSGIILAGDFNFNDILWEYDEIERKIVPKNRKPQAENDFISAIKKSGLNQHINFKTYIKTLKCDTLDLVFTDNDHKVIDVMPEPFLGNSILAHIGISWKYIIPNAKVEREQLSEVWITNDLQKRLKKHDFYKAYEQLCQDFSNSMYST